MNIDRSDKKGKHWWSFFNFQPKKEISMFCSFGFEGFKECFIQDDQKIISKIFHYKKFNKTENKTTLVILRFSIPAYKKIKNFDKLSKTSVDLLHLINKSGKKHRLRNRLLFI